MKKVVKKSIKKITFDVNALKHWKSLNTKAKLDWLESAMKFGKLRKF